MSDSPHTGFGKFVPGFDFLQSLAKGASQSIPQMPDLANWIAPSLNPEELDKRIQELKAVHFWLEQNSKALAATVQALEVQKMTLATLKGMNFNLGAVNKTDKPAGKAAQTGAAPVGAALDPLQLWTSLTQQFQQIAASAMKDVGKSSAIDLTKHMAGGLAKQAVKAGRKAAVDAAKASTLVKKKPRSARRD